MDTRLAERLPARVEPRPVEDSSPWAASKQRPKASNWPTISRVTAVSTNPTEHSTWLSTDSAICTVALSVARPSHLGTEGTGQCSRGTACSRQAIGVCAHPDHGHQHGHAGSAAVAAEQVDVNRPRASRGSCLPVGLRAL